ncbi:MAG: hypothetical protein GEU83_14820 [Pseudonocardiaceae bacterium]|nr:hypothetical protein [Pseudonocardiaceae bacterium]
MSEEDATTQRRASEAPDQGGVLTSLLAPLRFPARVLDALGELVESVRDVPAIRSELAVVRERTEPLGDMIATLERINEGLATRLDAVLQVITALESERSHLNRTVGGLHTKVDALHEDLAPIDDRLVTLERTTRELAGDVNSIRNDVVGIKDDIQRVTGLRGERGPIERARDKLTGGDDTPARGRPEARGS